MDRLEPSATSPQLRYRPTVIQCRVAPTANAKAIASDASYPLEHGANYQMIGRPDQLTVLAEPHPIQVRVRPLLKGRSHRKVNPTGCSPSTVVLMRAQLEHKMAKERRSRLLRVRNKTYELNGLVWAVLLADDGKTAEHDLKWAAELSLEVARELLECTGGNKQAIADWLSAAPHSPSDQG